MTQALSILLKLFGFIGSLVDIWPGSLLIPEKVLDSNWDEVMSSAYAFNFVLCFVALLFLIIYYKKIYQSHIIVYKAWWITFVLVFIFSWAGSVWLTFGSLTDRQDNLIELVKIIFPIGFGLAADSLLLFLLGSLIFWKRPKIVAKALPPVCWFVK